MQTRLLARRTHGASRRRRSLACGAAVLASAALGLGPSAQAAVVLPSPGVMRIDDLPLGLRAGHTFTLREVLPMAVWFGSVRFQEQTSSGGWRTLATAPLRPRVFWLHLWVPARWSGAEMTVRFVLLSKDQTLALSPTSTMRVTGSSHRGLRR
jgi:hypothetical protein